MIGRKYFISFLIIFVFASKYACEVPVGELEETLSLTPEDMKLLTSVRDEAESLKKTSFEDFHELLKAKSPELAEKISSARDTWNSKFDNLQTDAKAWMEEVRQAKPRDGQTLTSEEMTATMEKIRSSFNNLSEEAKKELETYFPPVVRQMGIENENYLKTQTKEPNQK